MDKSLAFAEGNLVVADDRLTLLRGQRTLAAFPVDEIRALRVEEAKAFRHPWLGLAFAAILLVATGWPLVTALENAPAFFASRLGVAVLVGFVLGLVMLLEVLRSPRIYWLRVRTQTKEQRLALPGADLREVEELVQDVRRANCGIS